MSSYEITAGWTSPLDINLLTRGASPSGVLIGMSAELVLRDLNGNTVTTSGDVSIPDTNVWQVRYTPDAADLVPGVFHMRVKLTDVLGQISYFPSGEWDTLRVYEEG